MCVRPITVNDNVVPCGKCYECKRNDRMNWSIRVQDTIKDGTFITLTYSDEYHDGKLHKKHLIDYLKRLREHIRKKDVNFKLQYFAVGEYGDRFKRPHYHCIINYADTSSIKEKWQYGHVHTGRVTNASIHYCTKYIQKNSGWKKDQKPKEIREFRIMSKSLGQNWIKRNKEHYRKNRITYLIKDGKKYALPRYFIDKIFKEQTIELVDIITGQITKYITQERIDISDKQRENAERKLLKLAELYKSMLHKDVDNAYRKRADKYYKMYESLNIIKNTEIRIIKDETGTH